MNEPDISLAQSLIIKNNGGLISPHLTRFALAAAAASLKLAPMTPEIMESGGIIVNNGGDFPLYTAPAMPQNIIWSKACSSLLAPYAQLVQEPAHKLQVLIEDSISITPNAIFAPAGSLISSGRAVTYSEVVGDFRYAADNRYTAIVVPCDDLAAHHMAVFIIPSGCLSINALLTTPYLVQTAFAVAMTATTRRIRLRMPNIDIDARGDVTEVTTQWAQSMHKPFRNVQANILQHMCINITPRVDGTLNFANIDCEALDMRRGIVWIVKKNGEALVHLAISAF